MTGTLADLCEELDRLVIQALILITRFLQSQQQLNTLIKDGFLNMSKARYCMGSHRVSILQVDLQESVAQKVVAYHEVHSNNLLFRQYELISDTLGETEDTTTLKSGERSVTKVRKRQKQEKSIKETRITENEVASTVPELLESQPKSLENSKVNRKKDIEQDPLKWFGVLVSRSLQHCQQNFQQLLLVTVDMASTQSELSAVISRFRSLSMEKIH
ncbi:coiled-coil domain-containing protein 115-like [Limulus polyphemus]|uniref:Vacuolar ATPase assembly protein VMA22 n=1 Tax=Limulus polyphemus TaxID=6850 RepID=A0ABM1BN83_LIMPO|nr:coiled-coil domain-containing protein 115-like [Limulus polyphemus]XP_022253707.1 coiled-coil domain-containing protein 115-like [Limulus polyphemus]XP_022253708.1 coiled-coil domain-containing protein 115-like [Limulus polyphemus]